MGERGMGKKTVGVRHGGAALAAGLLLALAAACSDSGGITDADRVTALRFVVQPGALEVGQSFTVAVELVDAAGQRVSGATDLVSLSLPGGPSLGGTTARAATAGLATFEELTVAGPGSDLRLTATSGGLQVQSDVFQVTGVDPCAPRGVVALGETVTGTLSAASCLVEDDFFTDFWQLELSAETTIQVDLSSTDFDAFMFLLEEDGTVIDLDDDGGPGLDARIVATLPAGTYFIEASTALPREVGDYELTVSENTDGSVAFLEREKAGSPRLLLRR